VQDEEMNTLRQRHEQEKLDVEVQHNSVIRRLKQSQATEIDMETKKHNAAMAEIRGRHEKEMKSLQETNRTAESQAAKLRGQSESQNNEVEAMKRDFEAEKARLRKEFETEIEALKQEHEAGKETLKQQCENEIAALKNHHQEEMGQLLSKNQKEKQQFDELKNDLEEKTCEMKERNLKELASLQEEHAAEMQRRTESYEKAKAALEAEMQDLDSKAAASAQSAKISQIKAGYQDELEELATQHKRALEQETVRQNRALEQIRVDFESQKAQFESQKAQIEEELCELATKRSELEEMESQLEAARSQLALSKSQLSSVQSQLTTKQSDADRKSRFLCFASHVLVTISSQQKKRAIARLALSVPHSHTANPQQRLFSTTTGYVADFPPPLISYPQHSSILFPFQESRLQTPFSRISEIPSQIPDPDRIVKSRELNFKLKKVHGKIETTTAGFGTAINDSIDQIGKSCQDVKVLANEQARLITQLTLDFQQQTGQLSRNFQNAVCDVEGSFRMAISFISSMRQFPLLVPRPPVPVYPSADSAPHSARPKRVQAKDSR
jgi:myosin heavy subunit